MLDSLTYHHEPDAEKLHDWNIRTKSSTNLLCEKSLAVYKKSPSNVAQITWTVSDLAKAGGLLNVPQILTSFDDEQEMRRVYTLIYDVFRYKTILMQALNDINFFQIYEKLQQVASIVWLLFYDLYHRGFKKRETAVARQVGKLFQYAGMTFAENALWCQRVKLAAAVARIRIKHNALNLAELLPAHLRNDRVAHATRNSGPLTVWVNSRKFRNGHDIVRQIEAALKLKFVDDGKDLGPDNFKWDRHCPLTIAFHCSMRQELAKSLLVKTHKLIVQDRSFCLGPATFWRVVEDLQLCGSVVQTHVNSPRSTAYLATLLAQNERINKLMAFSAGKRKKEYDSYLNDLGMTNVEVFSDKLMDVVQESPILEEVVAVYATPPNSYSAVNDPVDLVCSRGGDLSMLEILTEAEDSIEGRNRVTKILEEQRKTLKFAMSKPQIQVVLYETHSELEIENADMVKNTINDINKIAKLHHASMQGLITDIIEEAEELMGLSDRKEINNNEEENNVTAKGDSKEVDSLSLNINLERLNQQDLHKVEVPDTDLFVSPELPCLCPSTVDCLSNDGCYLALLQRKQVIRLDNKYMIQMAEQRGLFGSTSNSSSKSKLIKQQRKKVQLPKIETKAKRPKKKFKEIEEKLQKVNYQKLARLGLQLLKIYKEKNCKTFGELMQEYYRLDQQMRSLDSQFYYYNRSKDDIGHQYDAEIIDAIENSAVSKSIETEPEKPKRVITITTGPGGLLGQLSVRQIKRLVSSSFKIGHNNNFFKNDEEIVIRRVSEVVSSKRNQDNPTMSGKDHNVELDAKNKASYHELRQPAESQTEVTVSLAFNVSSDRNNNVIAGLNDQFFKHGSKKIAWTSDKNKRFFQLKLAKKRQSREVKYERKIKKTSRNDSGKENAKSDGDFKAKSGTGKTFHLKTNDLQKVKINDEIIKRIANATEASKIRSMDEDLLPAPKSTIRGTVTRGFVCELCKKRHKHVCTAHPFV